MSCQSDTFVVSCMRSMHFCCTLLMHHFGDANIAFMIYPKYKHSNNQNMNNNINIGLIISIII